MVALVVSNDDAAPADEIREAAAIARRAVTLFAVVGVALGASKDETIAWLRQQALWPELSPRELDFVTAAEPTQRQTINASWRSEGVLVLLWSLGAIAELPSLDQQCDPGDLQPLLPPSGPIAVGEFIASARRRSDGELQAMATAIMDAHWELRDARLNGRSRPDGMHPSVVQERHHAINWVIGYGGEPWDSVATDT